MLRRVLPSVVLLVALLATATPLRGQDAPAAAKPDATQAKDKTPVPDWVLSDLDVAVRTAREAKKPLAVVAGPTWYVDPAVTRLDEKVLSRPKTKEALAGFVVVRVGEGEAHPVHVRHRLPAKGYPLTVVLSAEGTYLGSLHGLEPARWADDVARIPARHARMAELRERLRDEPEAPALLLELAELHLEADEADRADALLERFEAADRADVSGKLGEARYLRLTLANHRALVDGRFADVEAPCLKWLRRFREHARRPDVLAIQANARFLNGEKEKARAVWAELAEKHAATDAGKQAKKALADLAD